MSASSSMLRTFAHVLGTAAVMALAAACHDNKVLIGENGQPITCQNSSDCPSSAVCAAGVCQVEGEGGTGGFSTGSNGGASAVGGGPAAECTSSADCPCGQVCVCGTCHASGGAGGEGGYSTGSVGGAGGFSGVGGGPAPASGAGGASLACTSNADCPSGETCQSGVCAP